MTTRRRFTLTQYLIEQRRRFPSASGDFNALLLDVALACKAIARTVAFGDLGSMLGQPAPDVTTSVNVQGEEQKKLDEILGSPAALRRLMVREIEADAKTHGDERRDLGVVGDAVLGRRAAPRENHPARLTSHRRFPRLFPTDPSGSRS